MPVPVTVFVERRPRPRRERRGTLAGVPVAGPPSPVRGVGPCSLARRAGADRSEPMAPTAAGRGAGTALSAPDPVALPRPLHRRVILAVLCVSLLVVSLDSTILNVALPSIVRAMHATSSQLQWIVDAYVVVFAGLLLVARQSRRPGRAQVGLHGRPRAVRRGLRDLGVRDDARPAHRRPRLHGDRRRGDHAVDAVDPRQRLHRPTTNGSRRSASGRARPASASPSGPWPAAGLLAHYWWGSVFLVNVPIALVGLCAAAWFVPNSRNPESKRPDLVGALLSILGMGLLLWGIIEAPNRSWTSPAHHRGDRRRGGGPCRVRLVGATLDAPDARAFVLPIASLLGGDRRRWVS